MEASPERKIQTTTDLTINTSPTASVTSNPVTTSASKIASPDRNTTPELVRSESKVLPLTKDATIALKFTAESIPAPDTITAKLPTTPHKSPSEYGPSAGSLNSPGKSTGGVAPTSTGSVKVNSAPGPALSKNDTVKVISKHTNNVQAVKLNPPVIHSTSPPNVQPKPNASYNNKENVKPVPASTKTVQAAPTGVIKTSPKSEYANPANRELGQLKRLRELQSKCHARGISAIGNATELVHRLLASDQREREFEQEHEKQMKEFRKQHAEDQSRSVSQASSRISSPTGSQKSNDQSKTIPAPSQAPVARRQDNCSGANIPSPAMPNTITPALKCSTIQNIQAQPNTDSTTKANTVKSTVSFASHDIRLESNAVPALVVAARTVQPSGSQAINVHPTGVSASANTTQTARRFASQDIRVYRDAEPSKASGVKTVQQINGPNQTAKPTETKLMTTARADDKVSFLHKHNFEIKNECLKKGLSGHGSRKDLVSRLMTEHLSKLKAEFKRANEYAKAHDTDSEALIKKEILWFRIECFLEHSTNQIGLAKESSRAASYAAARAGKYVAPRHAKIMNGILAQLITQERKLEAEKVKKGL